MKSIITFSVALAMSFTINLNSILAQGLNSISTVDGVNIIAVGNNGLIFRSQNGGNSWSSYTIASVNFKHVFSVNNNVWIAGDNGKIYKTLKVNSPVDAYDVGITSSINSLCFLDDNNGFLCGDGGVVYKTVNGGVNWTSANNGIPSAKLNSISFLDANKGIVAGDNGTVYLTTDAGSSWNIEAVNTTRNLLKTGYLSDGIVIVGGYGTLLLKPNSSPWTSVSTRTRSDIRGVTGSNMNSLRICGGGGFIRNNSIPDNKFNSFEANPMMANLVDIIYYNSDLGFAVSSMNSAIIRTTNGGVTWLLPTGTTMTRTWVSKLSASSGIGNNLCMHPNNRDAMFVVYGSTVYVSRNRGENWSNIATVSGGGQAHSFYVSPLDTNIWVCAITGSPDRVTRTTNYGATWTTILSMPFSNYGQPLEMDQNNPYIYYFAPDNGGFYKSTNNGASFAEISNNYPFRSPCDIIVAWDSSDVVFVGDGVTGSGQAKIFKSVNGGVNWAQVYSVPSSETPSLCNTVFEKNVAYSTEWGGSGFYKTTNFGDNWTLAGTTGSSGWGSDVCHEDPTVVLKGSYGSPTYLSTNSGVNFSSNSIQGGCGAGIIVPERGYLISMQCSGLFKMNITYSVLTDISNSIINSAVPTEYVLSQNFPNPFNPNTVIRYSLIENRFITLKIYDALGNEVTTLVNEKQNIGNYEVAFNASNLPSGAYFYRLEAGDISLTRKMVLLK